MTSSDNRKPWHEGPEAGAPEQDWLSLDDDEILFRLETLDPNAVTDSCLIEIVRSDRHFFIRQEAAKRVNTRQALFDFEDDRHIGQILVRQLNRREDLAYLGRLAARSRYWEVRNAAQVQLRRLRERLGVPPMDRASGDGDRAWRIAVVLEDSEIQGLATQALPAPEFEISCLDGGGDDAESLEALDPHLVITTTSEVAETRIAETLRDFASYVPLLVIRPQGPVVPVKETLDRVADEVISMPVEAALLAAKSRALLHFAHEGIATADDSAAPSVRAPSAAPPTASPIDSEISTVDAMLLAWAIHFIVEPAWVHLGTEDTVQFLAQTRSMLATQFPSLADFVIDPSARVNVVPPPGTLLGRESVAAVASWMEAFLAAASRRAFEVTLIDVRKVTAPMAEALGAVGFYEAFDEASSSSDGE